MSTIEPIDITTRVDDMHNAVLSMLPDGILDLTDVHQTRANLDALLGGTPVELPPDVAVTDEQIAGHDGDPEVGVRIYRPENLTTNAPAMLWIHGGGMVLGSAAMDDAKCAAMAIEQGCLIVSVDYRLAPEHPYPAAIHDCYAGLNWLAANASDLGVDTDRIAIGGASAGGGLAAGVALLARDDGGPALCFQLLVFPMLDHRNTTTSSQRITDGRVWNRASNIEGWRLYLGGADPVPAYASPTMATDLSGLPPAFIQVGDLDMFLDEDIEYAQRLGRDGVAAELHVYPGAFHGSNGFVPDAETSIRWREDEAAALRRAFTP